MGDSSYFYTLNDYTIYKDGSIYSKKNKKFIKPEVNIAGYFRVRIGHKRYFVHRLVAEKYIPNPNSLPCVNHIDGNRQNNCVNNLEWCSYKENATHALRTGLTPSGELSKLAKLKRKDVLFILNHSEFSAEVLAEKFNVIPRTIRNVRNRKTWKYI